MEYTNHNLKWTKERPLNWGRKRIEEKKLIHKSAILRCNRNHINYIDREFGSFPAFIEELGLDYEIVSNPKIDTIALSNIGLRFEDILGKIFDLLRMNLKCQNNTGLEPDFIIEGKDGKPYWIDAKLNPYSNSSHKKTRKKYLEYCDRLELVTLVGEREYKYVLKDSTKIYNVFYFVEQLEDHDKRGIIKQLEDLIVEYDNIFREIQRNYKINYE